VRSFILKNPPENKMSKEEKKCVVAGPGADVVDKVTDLPAQRPACICLPWSLPRWGIVLRERVRRLKKAEEERLRDADKAAKREKKCVYACWSAWLVAVCAV
jgi:hypothetical protein